MSDETEERPRINLRRAIVLVVIALGSAWIGWNALAEPDLPDFEAAGDPMELPTDQSFPSVSVDEFEGMLVGLRGQPVVVNLWASWCAPCRTEMPLLQKAADTFSGRAVILGVATNDDPAAARQFLDELGLTYPNVFDTTGRIRVDLGLSAYPTTYVFGSDGKIRARINGGISEQRLAGLIDDALT